MPVAGGEQESSLRRFRWMIEHKGVDVVQPDLFYFGGFVRSIRVARMAAPPGFRARRTCRAAVWAISMSRTSRRACRTPGHSRNTRARDDSLPVSSDTSPLTSVNGMLKVPTGPGLGVTIDPGIHRQGGDPSLTNPPGPRPVFSVLDPRSPITDPSSDPRSPIPEPLSVSELLAQHGIDIVAAGRQVGRIDPFARVEQQPDRRREIAATVQLPAVHAPYRHWPSGVPP